MLFQYQGSTENQAVSFTQFLMGSVFHGFPNSIGTAGECHKLTAGFLDT